MKIQIKEVVEYNGHSLSANGSVNFRLKAKYSELKSTILLMQMLNNDILIKAKPAGRKALKLGMFRLKQIIIDGDGESIIKLNGISDYIEMDNLNLLPLSSEDDKIFSVLFEAEIEIEKQEDEEDDEE